MWKGCTIKAYTVGDGGALKLAAVNGRPVNEDKRLVVFQNVLKLLLVPLVIALFKYASSINSQVR